MNQETYEKIYGQTPKMNTYLVQLKDKSEGNTERVAGEFMGPGSCQWSRSKRLHHSAL